MKVTFVENIRKLMGWCPNEHITERKRMLIEYEIESINAGLPVKKWKLDLLLIGHICALLFASLFILPMSVYQAFDLYNSPYLALNRGQFSSDITLSVASALFSIATVMLIYNITVFKKLSSKLCYFNIILLSGLFVAIILQLSFYGDYRLEWSIYWAFVWALFPSVPSILSIRFNKRYGEQKLVPEGSGLVELIKRTMGWCPNASTIEIRKSVQFDDMMVNAPGNDGELTHATARWWNKWRNRVLLNAVILTLVAMTYYISYGRYNPDNFLAGIIYGLIVSIFTGIIEWRRLNKAAAGEFKKVWVTRKKKIMNYLIIFGFIIVVILIVGFIAAKTDIRISDIYASLSGFILFVWTQYLEVVYWERKNRKTLIVEKTSFYAIDIEAGGV